MSKITTLADGLLAAGLCSLEWKAQEADSKDILFYKLPDTERASVEALKQRISASNYGAIVVNSERDLGLRDANYLNMSDFFALRRELANRLYPLSGKKLVAITGTNGKTTTVDIIRQVLVSKKIGVVTVGTLGVYLNTEKKDDFGLTSPDYIDLRKALFENSSSFEICALEASSHAICQHRLDGFEFDAIGWTSFSQDHLDYHKTMDEYFLAKKRLLNHSTKPFNVSPRASSLAQRLGKDCKSPRKIEGIQSDFFKSEFNKVNLEVALGCLEDLGIQTNGINLERIAPPPGRFNTVKSGERLIVVDFAHTPDAIESICSELKKSFPEKQLVCLFGCGGDRDKSKRPLMGAAAGKFADYVYVTSDNPRFEDPEQIISDIEPGLSGVKYSKITDRAVAIKTAIEEFSNAVILIAGKGHEPYIDQNGVKRPYSDMGEVEKNLAKGTVPDDKL